MLCTGMVLGVNKGWGNFSLLTDGGFMGVYYSILHLL